MTRGRVAGTADEFLPRTCTRGRWLASPSPSQDRSSVPASGTPGSARGRIVRSAYTATKAPFSERGEAVRDDEDAGGGQEGQDHPGQPVVAPVEPLVGEQPRAIVLDDAADQAEPRAVRLADLADAGLDALPRAEPAIVGAVVGRVGVQPADGGADHL